MNKMREGKYFFICISFSLFSLLSLPSILACSVIARPAAEGTWNIWFGEAIPMDICSFPLGGFDWACVNEEVANDDFNRIGANATANSSFFTTGTGLTTQKIEKIDLYFRAAEGGGFGMQSYELIPFIKLTNGKEFRGSPVTMLGGLPYTDFSFSWASNPENSSPWSVAEVDGMEISVKADKFILGAYAKTTQIYLDVTYTCEEDKTVIVSRKPTLIQNNEMLMVFLITYATSGGVIIYTGIVGRRKRKKDKNASVLGG